MKKENKKISTKEGINLNSNLSHLTSDNRGITLVALIITIIVMLILVGVSISIAINGGLFDTTKKAAKGTEEAKRKEQELASGRIKIDGVWYDSLEDYAIGKQSASQGIGDLNEDNTKFIYEPAGWTNGEVKVKINTTAVTDGFTLQYSTDGISWNNYVAGTEIPISVNGGEVFARLVDSEGNEGDSITGNVSNIDKTAPTINTNLSGGETTETTIPLSIKVTDSVSGISKIEWYYKLETETDYSSKTDTYVTMNGKEAGEKGAVTKEGTLTGLKNGSTYNIYAVVYDVAGNFARSPEAGTINIATKKVIKPEVGDYVNYEPDTVSTSYSLLGKYSGYGDYNTSVKPDTLTTPNDQSISQEKLEWQVLKIHEDGSIDLIGTPTTQSVYFKGALGYNNGVYLMHDICKSLYSKPSEGIEARSVSLEDFEDEENGGNWKAVRDAYSNAGSQYGQSREYTGNYTYYPNLYAHETGAKINNSTVVSGAKSTDKYYTTPTEQTASKASNKLTVTHSSYIVPINEENYGNTAKVLGSTSFYWVAARCLLPFSDYTVFSIRFASSQLSHDWQFESRGVAELLLETYPVGLRPVVSLSSSSRFELVGDVASGVPNTYNITKY